MTGRRWELKLPHSAPPLSMNHRRHWSHDHRIRVQLMADTHWLLIAAKVPALDYVAIWLEWTPMVTRRRDTDNLEPTRKALIDAIVRAGLLPDDTREYVARPENVIHPPNPRAAGLIAVIADQIRTPIGDPA